MKFRQNLEAVFLLAAVLGTSASYATTRVPATPVAKDVSVAAIAVDPNLQTVVVTGRRLTAAQKAALN